MKSWLNRIVGPICLVASVAGAAANDLRLLPPEPNSNGVTLRWTSTPDAYYNVYYADALADWTTWRIAAARIPAASDTNVTSWTDESAQSQMAASTLMAARTAAKTLSEEEIQALIEKWKETPHEYPPMPPKEPPSWLKDYEAAPDKEAFLKELRERFAESQPSTMESGSSSNRFYKVARMGVLGFVDGWGAGADARPSGLTNILAVSASPWDSGAHSLALRAAGTVVAWGNNFYGQCNVPSNVTDVVAVAAGGRHSLALKTDGTVIVWGNNSFGQVTNAPTGLTNVLDVKAGLWHSLVLKADRTVAVWGDLFNRSNAVPAGLSNVIAIAAGPRHCLALKHDHTVVGWGFDLVVRGYYRMTNVPPYLFYLGTNAPAQTNNVVWLDAGSATPTNLPPGVSVFGNFLPTNALACLTNLVAISAGFDHNQALRADGGLVLWGRTNAPVVLESPPLTNAAVIGAGWHQAVAVDADTRLASWGQGGGPLGMDSVVGLSVGALHTLVVRTNNDSPVIRSLKPRRINRPVGTQTNVAVTATASTSLNYQWQRESTNGWVDLTGETSSTLQFANLTRTDNGAYRVRVSTATGTNTSWPLTVETIYPPVIIGETPDPNVVIRAAQGAQTNVGVCVNSEGSQNVRYQWFKDGGPSPFGALQLPMSLCSTLSIALRGLGDEGAYWTVASNEAGSVTSRVWQVRVKAIQGEAVVWGGTNYGQLATDRTETNLIAIAAGGSHTLGLRENGTVIAWGATNYGQTTVPAGLTNVTAIAAGGWHSLAVSNGAVVAWGDNADGQTDVPEDLTNVVAVAAGGQHSLALRRDGSVVGWGYDSHGQASGFAALTNVAGISAGAYHSLALLRDGTVRVCGHHADTMLAPPAGLSNVVALAAGSQHNLTLKADGTVAAWGWNLAGETVVPEGLNNVIGITAGDLCSLALKNDGRVVVWGSNDHGQTNVPPLVDVYAVSAGWEHSVALAYNPLLMYPVDVAKDLLLIVNTHSTNSTSILNYYLAHRPGVSNANVLEISTPPGGPALYSLITNTTYEMCSLTNYYLDIERPYLTWLTNNPTKRPRYVLMMYDVPSRRDGTNDGWFGYCVARNLSSATPGRKPFITHLNMKTVADCQAYIDKLETFGNLYSPGKLVISASAGGYGNANYLIDDVRDPGYNTVHCFRETRHALTNLVALANIVHAEELRTTNTCNICRVDCPTGCTNVAAYLTWGYWGSQWASWAYFVKFSGASGWYIMNSNESWNGQWGNEQGETRDGQYSFHLWFDTMAFGGTNYSNTPVGAVTTTTEPGGACYALPQSYLPLWAAGKNFAICAWQSQGSTVQATGDPLVRR